MISIHWKKVELISITHAVQLIPLVIHMTQHRGITDCYQRMRPWDDYYPVPLFSGQYYTVKKDDKKLLHAMYYLQPSRFAYLLGSLPDEKVTAIRDGFRQNLLGTACMPNHPSNLFYEHHHAVYDEIFWTIIGAFKDRLHHFDTQSIYDQTPIIACICYRRSHYFYALLNYGFNVSEEDLKEHASIDDDYYGSRTMIPFVLSDKLKTVMESDLPVGRKLLAITDSCPISLEPIKHPVIIEDGSIYEYTSIINHFHTNGLTSPVTGLVVTKYIYHFLDDRFEVVSV